MLEIILSGLDPEYLIFQLEEGEKRTPHFQGYLYLKNPRTMKGVSRVLKRARLAQARGTAACNKEYCTKEAGRLDGPWEHGTMPAQGKRGDIREFVELVKSGTIKCWEDAVMYDPGICARYDRFVERLLLTGKNRAWPTEAIVYFGKAGKGKSRKAWEEYPLAYAKPDGKWFNGYQGQETIIWDDFDDAQVPLGLWLKLCDRYPFMVETKGGYVPMLAKRIIFTSNLHPDMWFPMATTDQREAINRRIVVKEQFSE